MLTSYRPRHDYILTLQPLQDEKLNRSSTSQAFFYVRKQVDNSLLYGVKVPLTGEKKEGIIPKRELTAKLTPLEFKTLLQAFSAPEPLKKLTPFLPVLVEIVANQSESPCYIRVNPGLFHQAAFPRDTTNMILGWLEYTDIANLKSVNKARCQDVASYQERIVALPTMQIELEKEKAEVEKKNEQEWITQQTLLEESLRPKQEEYQRRFAELKEAEKKLNEEYQQFAAEKKEREEKEKKAFDEKRRQTIAIIEARIQDNQKRNEDKIGIITSQIKQLDRFLQNAREEKENKPWWNKRIYTRNLREAIDAPPSLWSLGQAVLLTIDFIVGMNIYLIVGGWRIPEAGSFGATIITAGLGWPIVLWCAGIFVLLTLVLCCTLFICFDRRGAERFNDEPISLFSPSLNSDLKSIKKTFSLCGLYTICEMSEALDEKGKQKPLPKNNIYMEFKEQILNYRIGNIKGSITKDIFEKELGEEKGQLVFGSLEYKPTVHTFRHYKNDILKIMSKNRHLSPDSFGEMDVNRVTIERACNKVQEHRAYLMSVVGFFKSNQQQTVESKEEKHDLTLDL